MPSSPSPLTAEVPTAAITAPTIPPISACEELDGRPKYQVIRFQAIAPTRPAKMTVGVIAVASTMSSAIVAATWIEMKAPTKLRIAAMPTAARGDRAWVEIDVATTLAVSWKPFVKSNTSAVPITITSTMSPSTPPPFLTVTDGAGNAQAFLIATPSMM